MITKIEYKKRADGSIGPSVIKYPEYDGEDITVPTRKIELPDVISHDIGFEMMFGFSAPKDMSRSSYSPNVTIVPMRMGIKNSAR